MASTSVQKSFKYDVFLSFRGEDTRKNFVDHLHQALTQKGINTFKDDERIEKGEKISEQLIKSIENSRFYIIVFSKNYASSSWCLDELVKIMECQKTSEHTAYPVFYDVEPTQVRNQIGSVGEAFAKHARGSWSFIDCICSIVASCCNGSSYSLINGFRIDMEKEEDVGRWRNALKEAAGLAGMELKNTFNGHEAKLIEKIVEDVSQKLHFISLSVDGKLVGMETRVKSIVSSLEIGSDDVRMIGIKGIGGGGKTTLARAVFNHISFQFEGKSFVENVREVSKGSLFGLKELQQKVISDVLNDQSIIQKSSWDLENMMRKMMRGRKVLVVLDDVDDIEQLEKLAGELTWFHPGSRIIITTRDEQVLIAHRVNFIHHVTLLSNDEAMRLFNRYATGKDIPNEGYKELSGKVVQYAAGLPLTVKLLGSHLCGRTTHEWVDAIERLKTIPLEKTLKRLELSYNGLNNDEKEIFLDVVCILKGEMRDEAIKILESCGFNAQIGLRVLEQKSLITISYTNCLGMHDHIEEMGWNIVRSLHPNDPSRHNRLWIKDEIEDILVNESGTEATRSMKLKNTNLHPSVIMKGLRKMKELRFLYMDPRYRKWEVDEVGQYLPDTLRSLYWLGYPFCCLPQTFQANRLVNLQMDWSNISELWKGGERKGLNKLRFLSLKFSKLRTFDLGMTPLLEKLDLRECSDFVKLYMHVDCPKLKYLNLSGTKVRNLDLEMTRYLEIIDLGGCSDFVKLHMTVKCPKLKSLDLSGSKVSNLDLRMTPCLETLSLRGCSDFVKLHMPVDFLNLKSLNLSGSKVSSLNIGLTPYLEKLDLGGCSDFVELHMPVDCPKLKSITLSGSKVTNLNLGMTPYLETLDVHGCSDFLDLHMPVDCPKLKILDLSGSKVSNLNLGMTPHLKNLYLQNCSRFKQLYMPVECLNLEHLFLGGSKVSNLNLELTPNLSQLDLKGCSYLQEIHAPVGCLKYLVYLNLSRSSRFKYFHLDQRHGPFNLDDSLATLELIAEPVDLCPQHPNNNLPKFQFRCIYDEHLPSSRGNLEKLISFGLCACTNLESFSASICGLQRLGELSLEGSIPEVLKDLNQLESLKELSLSMKDIKHLPDSICMLKHLKCLELKSCWLLEQLPKDLGILEHLEDLYLIDCTSLRDIPNNICEIKCLERLHLPYCVVIEKLPEELGLSKRLKELNIEGTCISRLPQSIYQLKGLRIYGSRSQLESYGFTSLTEMSRYTAYCHV